MRNTFTGSARSPLATAVRFPWTQKMFPFNWLLILNLWKIRCKEKRQKRKQTSKACFQRELTAKPKEALPAQIRVRNVTPLQRNPGISDTRCYADVRPRWNMNLVCGVSGAGLRWISEQRTLFGSAPQRNSPTKPMSLRFVQCGEAVARCPKHRPCHRIRCTVTLLLL